MLKAQHILRGGMQVKRDLLLSKEKKLQSQQPPEEFWPYQPGTDENKFWTPTANARANQHLA